MRRLLASAASSRTSPSCAAGAPPPADERAHSRAAGESETSFAGLQSAARTRSVGSVNGDAVPFAGAAAYAMTKSALQGLARGLARDLGERGITVNIIQPGPVDTDMNPADGEIAGMVMPFMAIKRYGKATEIAGMAAYLAGPEASYITGAMHTIDGGFGA